MICQAEIVQERKKKEEKEELDSDQDESHTGNKII